MNTTADFFCAGGGGRDDEIGGLAESGCYVFKDELGHGAAADVAVANK